MEFRSKTASHQIQMTGAKTEIGPYGTKVVASGKNIVFTNHRYMTNDPDEIRFLKARPDYGVMIAAIEDTDRLMEPPKTKMISGARGVEDVVDEERSETALNTASKNTSRKEKS